MNDIYLIPFRHACGEIVHANLEGDYPIFYDRHSAIGIHSRLKDGKRPILSCPRCDYPLSLDWMRRLYHVDPMPSNIAELTIARRVCSNCWGQLQIVSHGICVIDDDGTPLSYSLVLCHECKYETVAYVTQKYVGYAREKDYLDYGRCVIGLAEALELTEADGIPIRVKSVNRPVAATLAEMGF